MSRSLPQHYGRVHQQVYQSVCLGIHAYTLQRFGRTETGVFGQIECIDAQRFAMKES